jgi:chemotaxis regulatin CheY-phosphate phosphatase CheZ
VTQEELDSLMSGGLDDVELDESEDSNQEEESKENMSEEDEAGHDYKIEATKTWPPPPPTEDHKVVEQLDDVTKDSEKKATEIFDKLETISESLMNIEEDTNQCAEIINANIDLFDKLSSQFPKIEIFKEHLEKNKILQEELDKVVTSVQESGDEIMSIMDIMQYQDIHRQKIERVINVMRALSKYMNSLFETQVEDEKRVSSAVHIVGDKSTEDVVSTEDIEALIASLGKQ